MGSSAASPLIILTSSDDEKAPPVAAVPVGREEDEQEHPEAGEEYEWSDPDDDDGWLPDGFEVEGYRERDGSFKATGYICPVSGLKFKLMSQVLDYCVSDGMERAIKGKETLQDKTTLQGKYAWLREKNGWVLEIRAGGDNYSKMFKFYAHLSTGVRLTSKNEVLRYIDEAELPECVDGHCDISSEDNIIAQLEFNINCLPPGWVKETVFRKYSDGIRKDTYFTDPITKKVFRSLKSAEQYFISGGEPVGAHVPIMSVTDMYSFDRCTDMPPCLARRFKMEGTEDQQCEGEGQTSHQREEDGKGMLHGDVKEEQDEEEWHGDDEKEEVLFGDDKEENNKEALYDDGEDQENGQETLLGDVKEEDNEEGIIDGGDDEDGEEQRHDRYRTITELYKATTKSA
ncbi:unnamed protein product [Urochloa decumbens]|uniref:MBD domain-containing protein n=1 Tax=Urochloa decumbens TaxID=240449 RepID=A0ABC9CR95_9POAL